MDPEFFSFTAVIVLLHLCSYFFFSAVGELSLLTADKEILLRRHLVDIRRGDMTEMILRYLLKWWLSSQDHSSFVNLVFLWQRMKGKWRSVIPFWHAKRHDISLHDKIPHTELCGNAFQDFMQNRMCYIQFRNVYYMYIFLLFYMHACINTYGMKGICSTLYIFKQRFIAIFQY